MNLNVRMMAVTGLAAILLAAGGTARADVLNMGGTRNADGTWTGLASLETVRVGNPGNAGELSGPSAGGSANFTDRICGAVSYEYNIGKYEVTAGQYAAFLNAVAKTDTYGLYNTNMGPAAPAYHHGCQIERTGTSGSYSYSVAADWANRPVNYVSYGDAFRFANWLHNGQPTGAQDLSTTEDGAYYLNGATTDAALLAVTRKAGWQWALASEDEWYKAAYYDPNKPGGAGYWDYATRSDGGLSNELITPDPGNSANFYDEIADTQTLGPPYIRTEVGAFENSSSAYGTFDQTGNVGEWIDTLVYYSWNEPTLGGQGGSADDELWMGQASWRWGHAHPSNTSTGYDGCEGFDTGFRVVQAVSASPVPLPAAVWSGLAGLVGLGGWGWLRRRCAKTTR